MCADVLCVHHRRQCYCHRRLVVVRTYALGCCNDQANYEGFVVAVKTQSIFDNVNIDKYLRTELSVLKNLRHPHLLRYVGAGWCPAAKLAKFDDLVSRLLSWSSWSSWWSWSSWSSPPSLSLVLSSS
jgi:hypothetical protein